MNRDIIIIKRCIRNKTQKGITRSAVPLPCLLDVVKLQRVAGQRPQQRMKSCRMGGNSVWPSICPSVPPPYKGSEGQPEGGGWTDGWMDWQNFSPFYRTCPLLGPLPCYPLRFQHIKEAGQGYCWPHDAFWSFICQVVAAQNLPNNSFSASLGLIHVKGGKVP